MMSASAPGSHTQQIDLARQGDPQAKAWLWDRYRDLLYEMTKDHRGDNAPRAAADMSDVVGEVALHFAKDGLFAGVEDRKHFKNRLRKIVQGKAINQRRRAKVRRAEPIDDHTLKAPADDALDDRLAVMDELMKHLPRTLHDTAVALMENQFKKQAAQDLNVSRHELDVRIEQIREIWTKHLESE